MTDPNVELDKASLIALVTDVYVAGFMDGRTTASRMFDRDAVLQSAFETADATADNLLGEKKWVK